MDLYDEKINMQDAFLRNAYMDEFFYTPNSILYIVDKSFSCMKSYTLYSLRF